VSWRLGAAAQHTDSGSAAQDKKKVEGLVRKNNFCDSTKSGKMWRWRVAVQAVVAHAVPVAQRKIGFGKLARNSEKDEPPPKSDEPPQNWVRKFRAKIEK